MPETEKLTTDRVYCGRRIEGTKLVYVYRDLGPDGTPDPVFYRSLGASGHRAMGSPRVGTLVRVTYANPERTRYHTAGEDRPRFVGTLDDAKQVTRWALEDRAAALHHKALKRDPFGDAVAPLRAAYLATHPTQRPAFLAALITEVSRG